MDVTHHTTKVNDIHMHYVRAGEGPPVLFLHGFPEFWYSWRHQLQPLSQHCTVIAPDLRGYNDTDKPEYGYDMDTLMDDVHGLLDVLGFERASLVGHDAGGALAWLFAINHPSRVERLAVLNFPHPALFVKALATNPLQMIRSIYISFAQIPWLPETVLRLGDYGLVDYMFRQMAVNTGGITDEDIQRYKEAIRKPGALTAALEWYRAFGLGGGIWKFARSGRVGPVEMPTMLIWGKADPFLGVEMTYNTERYAPNVEIHRLPGCSHWVQQECPAQVNDLLLPFLTQKHETEPSY
jgi:pimeloyl-ACP methyl ester carboxylesterase